MAIVGILYNSESPSIGGVRNSLEMLLLLIWHAPCSCSVDRPGAILSGNAIREPTHAYEVFRQGVCRGGIGSRCCDERRAGRPDSAIVRTVLGTGTLSVDTGNITAATATKTIPTDEKIGQVTATGAGEGIAVGTPVTLSTYTLNTTNGPFDLTAIVGDLTLTFTSISGVLIVPSTPTSQGSISEQFNGSVTGDTGTGVFLGQTTSWSETCTQTSSGALLSCSESVITPGLPTSTPEPMSLALLGIGVLDLGVARRWRH